MKQIAFIALLVLGSIKVGYTSKQGKADDILGIWQTGSGKAHVHIKKMGDAYYGQIVWLKNPLNEHGKPKLDGNNPDVSKRNHPIIGLNMLLGFTYAGNNKWENGTIYDPENGKTYSCKAELTSENKLNIRGYIGFSMIGRTDTWTRVK